MLKKINLCFFFFIAPSSCFSQEKKIFTFYFNTAGIQLNKKDCTRFVLLNKTNFRFHIKGHTDTVGSVANNKILSQKRTLEVYTFLKRKYKNCIIDSASYGEIQSSFLGNDLNRRVEVWIGQNNKEAQVGPALIMVNKNGEQIINFAPIFFYANQAVVRTESLPVLESILQKVNAIPDKKFEIRGHINWPLNREDKEIPLPYKQLSEQRARTIYTYLIEKGFDKKRLLFSGRENKEMLYPLPKNKFEMEQNMRVEIVVLQ